MEGVFLILIGGALFAQSWYVLGMYSDGRTMGIFVGGLGVLALGTIVFAFDPMLLTGVKSGKVVSDAVEVVAQVTVMKTVIVAWALYAIGVGAQGLWDFDERAIGFYSAFLAAVTIVPFIYFVVELQNTYSDAAWLAIAGGTLLLTLIAVVMFFYQAFQLIVLRLLSGWSLLIGGSAIVAFGLAIVSTAVK